MKVPFEVAFQDLGWRSRGAEAELNEEGFPSRVVAM
jgi:hypothetical protein